MRDRTIEQKLSTVCSGKHLMLCGARFILFVGYFVDRSSYLGPVGWNFVKFNRKNVTRVEMGEKIGKAKECRFE